MNAELPGGPAAPAAPGVLDLRLCLAAAACWLAVAIGLHAAGAGPVLLAGGLAAALGLVLLAGAYWPSRLPRHLPEHLPSRLPDARRAAPIARAVALAALGVGLGLIPLAATEHRLHASAPWQAAARAEHTTVDLTVRGDPTALASPGFDGLPRVSVQAGFTGGRAVIIAGAAGWQGVVPGQGVRVSGALQISRDRAELAIVLYPDAPPTLLGRPPWYQRAAGAVRQRLRAASAGLPDGPRGLLPGLIDGDTSGLDPVLTEHFRLAGLTHLVAVSGEIGKPADG